MHKVLFGDVVKEVKAKVDRNNNPYEYYVAGDHMDTEDLTIRRRGRFATDDVGPAFIREFHAGQILYGSRRTYLKKVAVADFDGVTANTTFVLETKDENVLRQRLIPFIMLSEGFTTWSITKSKGSTNPYVLFSDIAGYEFELPDIETQDKLVEVLWNAVKAQDSYKKLLQMTDELVKSQFIEMFQETEKVRLDTIADIVMGQSPTSDSYNFDGEGLPFYQGSADFSEKYVVTRMYCSAPTRVAQAGDILISVRAPVGTVNLTDKKCCIGRGLAAIRSKKSQDCNDFLLYAFRVKEDEIAAMGQGSTVLSINKDKLHAIMMPNASQEQQEQFISFARQSDKSKFALLSISNLNL